MEKKTIGKFIAVLRKANGMTQKELGDKLFVSDKTVSRWERDECTPELSLIPAIAEIFGITTDELLRGERNNPETVMQNEDASPKPSAKSEKQFKVMLHSRLKRYRELSLISLGLLLVGMIAAVICNTVFTEGLLGFCIACLFFAAASVCQICFAANARVLPDDDDGAYTDRINEANTLIVLFSVNVFRAVIAVFAFCLPLVTLPARYGINGADWFWMGLVCSAAVLFISLIIHILIVKPQLIERGMIVISENENHIFAFRRKNLLRITCVGGIIFAIFLIAFLVIYDAGPALFEKKEVYETLEDFKAALEKDQAEWIEEERNLYYIDKDGNKVYMHPDIEDDYNLKHATVTDFDGNVIFEYDYNPALYQYINFSGFADRTPVIVLKTQDYYDAYWLYETLCTWLALFMVIDIAICTIVYLSVAYGKKSRRI